MAPPFCGVPCAAVLAELVDLFVLPLPQAANATDPTATQARTTGRTRCLTGLLLLCALRTRVRNRIDRDRTRVPNNRQPTAGTGRPPFRRDASRALEMSC